MIPETINQTQSNTSQFSQSNKMSKNGSDSVDNLNSPLNTSSDKIPFLEITKASKPESLMPIKITKKLKHKKYPYEGYYNFEVLLENLYLKKFIVIFVKYFLNHYSEPKFLEYVKEVTKYQIKTYEVTMLIQIHKNEDELDILNTQNIESKFKTFLLEVTDKPYPIRITSIHIDQDVYPYQAELLVDFAVRIGKDPFNHKNIPPINYKEKGPSNSVKPRYIINYFMAMKEQTFQYPNDFIVLAKVGSGAYGEVELVKYRRNNQIYALKILKKLSEKEIKAFLNFDDKNLGLNNNIIREILFLKNLRDVQKARHQNIVDLENFWTQKEKDDNYRMYMLMEYFGGADLSCNCIFDFFFPNEGKSQPLHIDLGQDKGKVVIGQIFFQAIEAIHFLHDQGHIHRDIKDDNFLIRRREAKDIIDENGEQVDYIIEIALCDFGLTGYINKQCSLPTYNENKYRDIKNINQFPCACDIFSLGELLNMLIILYHFYWHQDLDEIFEKYKDTYKEEIKLSALMKSDIQNRPKDMNELKQSKEFIEWVSSLPSYIPTYFGESNNQNDIQNEQMDQIIENQ